MVLGLITHEQWENLGLLGFWIRLLNSLLILFLLAGYGVWLARKPWGRDLTRTELEWRHTEPMESWAGAGAAAESSLTEMPHRVKSIAIGGSVIFLLLTVMLYGMWLEIYGPTPDANAWLLLFLPLLGLLGYLLQLWVEASSRRIRVEDIGLTDTSFFRTLRVPWLVIASFKPAPVRSRAARSSPGGFGESGTTPATRRVWVVADKQDRELLRLGDDMVPAEVFAALQQRLHSPGQPATPDLQGEPDPRRRHKAAHRQAARSAKEVEAEFLHEHEKEFQRHASLRAGHNLAMYVGMAALLLPFLLGLGYMCYQTLWFQYAAAQVEGRVVEVKAEGLPSLVVEYRTADGKVLRTGTDGSDAYAGYAVGDPVGVFYDPAQPENVRLDFFLEHWLLPIILGGITLPILLMVVLIARMMSRPNKRR